MSNPLRSCLRFLAVSALFVAAGSCSVLAPRSIPESRLESWSTETFAVSEYHDGREGDDELVLTRAQVDALVAWLRAHRRGWQIDFVSYVPAISVRSTDTHLNILDGALVLNACIEPDDTQWTQWRCDVSAEERTALLAAIGLAR